MKITSLILATATAAPLAAPVQRNSLAIDQPIEQAAVEQHVEQQTFLETNDLFFSDTDFEQYMKYLDELPSEEWKQALDRLETALEAKLGISFEDLDKLTDEEFNRLAECTFKVPCSINAF